MHQFKTLAEILAFIDSFDVVKYEKTRNHLSGKVSRLSPYITRGVITLPMIRDRVLMRYNKLQGEKFIQELAWREYWQQVWWHQGDAIFSELKNQRSDWEHHDFVAAIVAAKTGIEVFDQSIKDLYETGYMHNHARMWVAMLAANVAKAHWLPMSRWMYHHLIDGDLASNMLSWQWVAGTNTGKRYVAHQELINACSGSRQVGTYLDIPRESIETMTVPELLKAKIPDTLKTTLPHSDVIPDVKDKTVLLFSPWTLDPNWHSESPDVVKILVIEPAPFERFSVSPKVMDFILDTARTFIEGVHVYVGDPHEIVGIASAHEVFVRAYPATAHWPGVHEATPRLFPHVTEYHQSFSSFWRACGY